MAEAAKDQDQSMEDILQSIKRIIAEEGDPVPQNTADVLELTQQLAEDGSVSRKAPSEPETPVIDSISIEEIIASPIASPTPVPEPAPEPEPALPVTPEPQVEDGLMSSSTLSASVAALNALRDSMNTTPPPVAAKTQDVGFRSGTTVEDLVVESLKPMLKEWLDTNLPGIVERLVQREISKLNR